MGSTVSVTQTSITPPTSPQQTVLTQLPPSYAAATQPAAPGMAPAAVFMYQNGKYDCYSQMTFFDM